MKTSRQYLFKSIWIAAIISVASIATFISCAGLIGFRYERKKFKAFIATLTLVLIYQFFFADVILMFLKAIAYTITQRPPWTGEINPIFVGGPNRKEFLERRIAALKSQLALGPTFFKRHEDMTLKYKDIFDDLILFGGYLAILFFLVIWTRDPLSYYNTKTVKDVLRNPKFSLAAISTIETSADLYDFINGTLVEGFNDGSSYNAKPFRENGWMDLEIAKVLGVIRLRQIRLTSLNETSNYDRAAYGPGWEKNSPPLAYNRKFWRIFKPWEYQNHTETGSVGSTGKLHRLQGGGYVTLLGRNKMNSRRVLQFLQQSHWIDSYTAVIVIEFTLYNVDADMFTLVTIFAEQTAFNSFVMTDKIETFKLLVNVDNFTWYELLAFVVYFLVLMKVLASVVLKMWYSASARQYLSMSWNYVDITIVGLNMFIVIGIWIREVYVKSLLLQVETSKKNEFVPFYGAASIETTCTVLVAFLIAVTTLRLWKILQFARVFRVLTSSLHHAKEPLASTTFFIAVFLVSIGLSSYIINGSNSPNFAEFIKSVTSLMSMSFGFAATAKPSELNHGGGAMGFILYLLLVVVVTFFLLNMFITVVCIYFSQQKEADLERSKNQDQYTFWHFLQMEIVTNFPPNLFRKKTKTTSSKDSDVLRLKGGGSRLGKPKDLSTVDSEHVKKLELVAEILDTQTELLREMMSIEDEESGDEELSTFTEEDGSENSINMKPWLKNRRNPPEIDDLLQESSTDVIKSV